MSDKTFRTLYLHIGLEKTGTTSIQEFLERNREKLREAGIFLPGSLGHKNHKMLAAYAFEPGARDIAVTSSGVGSTSADVAAFRSNLQARLAAEIAESEATTGVISTEDLSRLFTREKVERVVDLLLPFCDRLQVIVFARRQDLLASSRYYSLVLGGSQEARVFPPRDKSPYYEYGRNIGNWANVLGDENVTLVRFPEQPRAENFNSVDRFCEILGLSSEAYETVNEQHVSYDAVNQIIMQHYNVLKDGYDQDGLKWLMSELTAENDRQFSHIPSAQQARAFYDRYRADNEALFARLGVADDMFTDDFSMYSDENMRSRFQSIAIRRLLGLLENAARPA